MIEKIRRNINDNTYDLIITDNKGNSFIMTMGGNGDLYWMPENYKKNTIFYIDSRDKITFSVFNQLFDAIKKNDNSYDPVLKDNVITFISEEWIKEESNILNIIKEDNLFTIKFIKNENVTSLYHRGCPICFCNSGSRVPKIESLFSRMFIYLTYHCDLIKIREDKKL